MIDVFGQALHDCWHKNQVALFIVRRDDGHTDKGSVESYLDINLTKEEQVILHHAKGKILDVGCGAGRHVLHFQNAGFDITGIDTGPMAIKVCQERGCNQVTQMDIFNPKFGDALFDTVLLFGNNIGIGGTLEGVKDLLKSIKNVTKLGGLLLMTTLDVTKTENEKHLAYQKQNKLNGRYIGELQIQMEYKGEVGEWFPWIHIQPNILRPLAWNVGWEIIDLVETKDGDCSIVLWSF